jgi:hypothetical protein
MLPFDGAVWPQFDRSLTVEAPFRIGATTVRK